MGDYRVIEIGEDSEAWLVVSQVPPYQETMSIAESRLAVIRTLREQLLPACEDAFASCVEAALDASCVRHEYAIVCDPESELVYVQSPVGTGAPKHWERLGACGVAVGFTLPDHHDAERGGADS